MQNTTEIRTWSVSWSIEVEATSAAAAASSVARDYLQAGHTATVFNVAPFEMVADNWGMPGEPVEVDTARSTEAEDRAAAWGQLEADLMEYELRHDYERGEVVQHVAHNLAALLPPAALKAAIDSAIADVLICREPSSGQGKADELRRMMEGAQ